MHCVYAVRNDAGCHSGMEISLDGTRTMKDFSDFKLYKIEKCFGKCIVLFELILFTTLTCANS